MFLGDFFQLGPVRKGGVRTSLLQRLPGDAAAHARNGQRIFLDGVNHAMFLYQTHRFKDRLVTPPRPCDFMPDFLQAMRMGKELTLEQRRRVCGWEVRGPGDLRLKEPAVRDGFEMAIGWEGVIRQMQYRCVREAREKEQMLLYVQAVDRPHHAVTKDEHVQMLQVPNINNTGHLMGLCPLYVGMRVRLTVKLSAKHRIVQDAAGEVVGVKFHPREFEQPLSDWRRNRAHDSHTSGHYRCRMMPRCVFVRFDEHDDDVGFGKGVVQVPVCRATWSFNAHETVNGLRLRAERKVTRYQFPLVPERVRTVQTAQGLGMDAATMTLARPANMSLDDWWLHLYVMLSRVRVAHRVLVYDLPPWDVLERGPPEYIREGVRAFERMMAGSFAVARERAREYGWDVGDGANACGNAEAPSAVPERGRGGGLDSMPGAASQAPAVAPRASPLGLPLALGPAGLAAAPGAPRAEVAAGAAQGRDAPTSTCGEQALPHAPRVRPGSSAAAAPAAFVLGHGGAPGHGRGRGGGVGATGAPEASSARPTGSAALAERGAAGVARGARGRRAAPGAPRDMRDEVARLSPTDAAAGEPAVLRRLLQRDLCNEAYDVPQEEVLRDLQWRCGVAAARGIRNLGDTCFVNAVAQVLLRVAPIRRVLEAHVRRRCPFGNACPVCALAAQAAALAVQGQGGHGGAPLAAAARAGVFQNDDFLHGQCDAAEFFRVALGLLGGSEIPTCLPNGPYGYRTAVQQHIFGIPVRQRRHCSLCQGVSDSGVLHNVYPLYPFQVCPRADPVHLQDLLRWQIQDVVRDATGCPRFPDLSDADRAALNVCVGRSATYTFWEGLPPVMFLSVNRACQRADGSRWYDRRRVVFPRALEPMEGGCQYEFSGVVVHAGPSVDRGHYTAYGVLDDNAYAHFNDDDVRIVSWSQFSDQRAVQSGAYVFAYVRAAGAPVVAGVGAAGSSGGAGGGAPSGSSGGAPAARGEVSRPASSEGAPAGKRCKADGEASGAGAASSSSAQPPPQSRGEQRRSASPSAVAAAGGSDATEPWRRFTPATVDPAKCAARTWCDGRGGQCPKARKQGRFCEAHAKMRAAFDAGSGKGWHGDVDGPIPEQKLREFMRRKTALGAALAAAPSQGGADGEGAPGGGAAARVAAQERADLGDRARSSPRRRVGEMAADAAEGRALREDPSERRQRLDIASHNMLEELRGMVMGRLRALQRDIPVNLNRMTESQLRQAYEACLPGPSREGND